MSNMPYQAVVPNLFAGRPLTLKEYFVVTPSHVAYVEPLCAVPPKIDFSLLRLFHLNAQRGKTFHNFT